MTNQKLRWSERSICFGGGAYRSVFDDQEAKQNEQHFPLLFISALSQAAR
jgi:hypothetical protein